MGDLLTALPTDKVEPSETEKQAVQLLFPPRTVAPKASMTSAITSSMTSSMTPRSLLSSSPASIKTRWSWCTDRAHLRRCLIAGILFCALTAAMTQPLLERLLQLSRLSTVTTVAVLRVLLFLALVWLLAW